MSAYDWTPFIGQYEKQFYDVKMPNDVVFWGIWPNAGKFRIPDEQRIWKRDRFLSTTVKFSIRPSRVDGLGMPVKPVEVQS